MATLHKIKAYLYDNVLTDDPFDLIARVMAERSLNVHSISETAATRGGADISAPSMEHAVNLWFKEMAYQLCDGFSVNTGWFTVSAHIRGVFNSPAETFNPDKHTLLFSFNQGTLLRREIAATEVQILGVAESGLNIVQVTDISSGDRHQDVERQRPAHPQPQPAHRRHPSQNRGRQSSQRCLFYQSGHRRTHAGRTRRYGEQQPVGVDYRYPRPCAGDIQSRSDDAVQRQRRRRTQRTANGCFRPFADSIIMTAPLQRPMQPPCNDRCRPAATTDADLLQHPMQPPCNDRCRTQP